MDFLRFHPEISFWLNMSLPPDIFRYFPRFVLDDFFPRSSHSEVSTKIKTQNLVKFRIKW
jgi:hypothetical protein